MPERGGASITVDDAAMERVQFSRRLQKALGDAGYSPGSPTQLAREFNIRFTGKSITVHAARKWIVGESIPTQEKLRTLAAWLGVNAGWLRYGGKAEAEAVNSGATASGLLTREFSTLIENYQLLDAYHRQLAMQMIRVLVHSSTQHRAKKAPE